MNKGRKKDTMFTKKFVSGLKRIFMCLFVFTFLLSVGVKAEEIPQTVSENEIEDIGDEVSAEIVHSGVDGDLAWSIDSEGLLTVSGNGDYKGWYQPGSYNRYSEWAKYSDEIIRAKVEVTGITSMEDMFEGCDNLVGVDLSELDTTNVTDMGSMFEDCSSLQELDISNLDTSSVTDMRSMFEDCNSLQELDISNLDTSNVTDMGSMFCGCSNLQELDVSNLDTTNVTSMSSMFGDCSSLQKLDVSNLDTSNVTNMGNMFDGCSNLQELDVSNLDTSKVAYMGSMFSDCSNLQKLDVSNLDTSKVAYMGSMFSDCSNLQEVNVSNFDTTNVTVMRYMFSDCSSLQELDVSNFDTTNVTDMCSMFRDCSNLQELDVSNFDTTNVTDMSYMFYWCSNLQELDVNTFDTSKVANMKGIFSSCNSLQKLDLRNFVFETETNVEDIIEHPIGITELYLPDNMPVSITLPIYYQEYLWINDNDTICTTTLVGQVQETFYERITSSSQYITGIKLGYTSVVLDKDVEFSLESVISSTSAVRKSDVTWTSSDESVVKVSDGMIKTIGYGTAVVTAKSQNRKTATCTVKVQGNVDASITLSDNSVELEKGNTKQLTADVNGGYTDSAVTWESSDASVAIVTDAGILTAIGGGETTITAKFAGNSATCRVTVTVPITEVGLSKRSVILKKDATTTLTATVLPADTTISKNVIWTSSDTSVATVTNQGEITAMDVGCATITASCGNVSDSCMITVVADNCIHYGVDGDLTWSIDSEGLLTVSGNGDYGGAGGFYRSPQWCEYADEIICAEVSVTGITSTRNMFYYCENMVSVDLSGLDTANVTDMSSMFSLCYNLKAVDVSGFDTHQVSQLSDMFFACENLTCLDLGNFNTCNVLNMDDMFYGCEKLNSLNISSFDTCNVYNMSCMFCGCTNLAELDVSHFDTSRVTNMLGMFGGCTKLSTLDVNHFDTSKVTMIDKMFMDCSSLDSLDLSKFDLSNITVDDSIPIEDSRYYKKMISGCTNLKTLTLPANVMFDIYLPGNGFDHWQDADGIKRTRAIKGLDTSMIYTKSEVEVPENIIFSGTAGDLNWRIDSDGVLRVSGEGDYVMESCDDDGWGPEWLNYDEYIESAIVEVSDITSTLNMFEACRCLKSVDFSGLNTSSVTSMSGTFSGCNSLTILKVPANLKVKLKLPIVEGYYWKDEDGVVRTEAILKLAIPMTYTRYEESKEEPSTPEIPDTPATPTTPTTPQTPDDGKNDAGSGAASTPKEDDKVLEEGTKLSDKKSGGKYVVTNDGDDKKGGKPEVSYTGTSNKKKKTVSIPSYVTCDGVKYKVTAVADKAFKGNKKVTNVKVPSTVTSVGNSAFDGCSNLKDVTVGSNVKSLGKNAFKNCKKLSKITIKSKNLKKVGKNALKGVGANCKIKVPKSKLKDYKKLLKGKGQKSTVKITK